MPGGRGRRGRRSSDGRALKCDKIDLKAGRWSL